MDDRAFATVVNCYLFGFLNTVWDNKGRFINLFNKQLFITHSVFSADHSTVSELNRGFLEPIPVPDTDTIWLNQF